MATKNVTPQTPLTLKVEFDHIPTDDVHLLAVLPGAAVNWALSEADCLDDGVRTLMLQAVNGGLDSSVAWLCEFAMGAARAFREAAGVVA